MSKKSTRGKKGGKDGNGDDKDALAFKVLSEENTKQLMTLGVVDIQNKLKDVFNLVNSDIDLIEAGTLDYYTSAVWWAIQNKFTAQQISGFFSVVHILLENVKEKHLCLVDNVTELKKMLVGIGMEDIKPAGLEFFNVQQARLISDYIFKTLFQHYSLYSYMFSHSQAEEIIGTDLEIEVAKAADVPHPPPLDEGVSDEMHQLYIATPPPIPSPQPVESTEDTTKALEDTISQSDMFANLTPQDVREVVESVALEMLGSLQSDVAAKLRDKENQIITRINKIHRVEES